jgi:diguanylate cyclase (GGDEF)-like protein
MQEKIKVLLVEEKNEELFFWKDLFGKVERVRIDLVHVQDLSKMETAMHAHTPDIVFFNPHSVDETAVRRFVHVHDRVLPCPVIVVIESDEPNFAFRTICEGAQDCLVKDGLDSPQVIRSIHHSIGRHMVLKQLRNLSLVDELTGLYNRRGFMCLVENQIKVAERIGHSLLLVFADVDELKAINDTLGHHRGDLALTEAAHVLRQTFRESDLLARLGGDEFVATLICDKSVEPDRLAQRFQKKMAEHNSNRSNCFNLSVSLGVIRREPPAHCGIDELLIEADQLMYQHKRDSKVSRVHLS